MTDIDYNERLMRMGFGSLIALFREDDVLGSLKESSRRDFSEVARTNPLVTLTLLTRDP